MSFYRTYRPQIITEIDNIAVREQLLSLLTKNKNDLPHAYLFEGPKGAGKTTAARIIAKLFNCEKLNDHGPCGVCSSCVSIANGSNIDVLEIDAASNRGIDDVRELRDRIKLAPAMSPFKIYIIDEVHMMTTEAFNALLKTLEEPPAHAVFVLATTDPQKVPATIRSRCMEIIFGKAHNDELLSALSRIVQKEKISIDGPALDIITKTADGAFRDAVKLLEQVSFHTGPIDTDAVVGLLSKSDVEKRKAFLTSVLQDRNISSSLDSIETYVSSGGDVKTFTTECLSDLQKELLRHVREGSGQWNSVLVQDFMKRLIATFSELRSCPIQQLPLELAVVEFLEERSVRDVKSPDEHMMKKPDEHMTRDEHVIPVDPTDPLTLEKLTSHWPDYIEALKPYNHSVAGVIRSARPKSVENGVVTIEAFYKFHQERLSDSRVRDILGSVLKKLFGVTVKVEIVLGKK